MSKVIMTCVESGCSQEVWPGGALCLHHRVKATIKVCAERDILEEDKLTELRADLELNYRNSPWAQSLGAQGWIESLLREADELLNAVKVDLPPWCSSCVELRKDQPVQFQHFAHHENCTEAASTKDAVRDEIGDVLWNLITLAIVTRIDFDAVLQAARDKLRRRKPWIFGIGPIPKTAEEEHWMYLESKAKKAKS